MRVRFLAVAGLIGATAVAATARRADACSCLPSGGVVSPADGATGVPVNALVFAATSRFVVPTVVLRKQGASTEVTVALDIRQRYPGNLVWTIGTPAALEPLTTYELTVTGAFEPSTSTFTTGDTTDLTPAPFAGITAMRAETMSYPITDCQNSCIQSAGGRVSRIAIHHEGVPTDAVVLGVRVYGDGVLVDEILQHPTELPDGHVFGFSMCDARAPRLDPGVTYCGEIVAYDIAGNVSGIGVKSCTAPVACEPKATDDGCTPASTCEPLGGSGGDCAPATTCEPLVSSGGGGCAAGGGGGPVLLLLGALGWLGTRRAKSRA